MADRRWPKHAEVDATGRRKTNLTDEGNPGYGSRERSGKIMIGNQMMSVMLIKRMYTCTLTCTHTQIYIGYLLQLSFLIMCRSVP